MDTTQRKTMAETTCSVFLDPIIGRQRLTVTQYAEVRRLLIRGDVVTGVEYARHGRTFKAHARKEVILSAGVIGTPLILFQSGIGPSKMLSDAKVE